MAVRSLAYFLHLGQPEKYVALPPPRLYSALTKQGFDFLYGVPTLISSYALLRMILGSLPIEGNPPGSLVVNLSIAIAVIGTLAVILPIADRLRRQGASAADDWFIFRRLIPLYNKLGVDGPCWFSPILCLYHDLINLSGSFTCSA